MKTFITVLYIVLSVVCYGQTKIENIEAKLYYNENKAGEEAVVGTFSENIIDNDVVLWNTIIGGGDAKGYSEQTIVEININASKIIATNQKIRLTVMEGKNIISQQTKNFSVVDVPTNRKILFLLDDTGCNTVQLKADVIMGGKIVSTMSKRIDFECGE